MSTPTQVIRILFIPNLFYPDRWNGIMEHMRILIQGLDSHKYKAFVAIRPDDGDQTHRLVELTGATPCYLDANRSISGVRELCVREQIDIVHIQTPVTGVVPKLIIGARLGGVGKILVTYQLAQISSIPLKARFVNRLVHQFFVDHVVAVSDGVAESLIRNVGIIGSPIRTVYNAVDTVATAPVSDLSLLRDGDRVWIGFFGRLAKEKGVIHLIEAFSRITRQRRNVGLLLVGDGYLRDELASQVRRLGLDDQIVFAGHRNDARALMREVDIIVLPSLIEGFSLVLVEAMEAARPVIATNIPGNREAIVDGVTGVIVPPADSTALADAMLTLVDNRSTRVSMGRCGRDRYAQLFDGAAMVAALEKMYADTV